jgi:hypothetical protein
MKSPLVIGDIDYFEICDIMEYMKDHNPDYGKPGGPLEITLDLCDPKASEDALTPAYWINDVWKLGAWKEYSEQLTEYAKENGYDGIINVPLGVGDAEIVVFEPNQIKSIENKYPTRDDNFKDNAKSYLKEHLKDMELDECLEISKYIKEHMFEEKPINVTRIRDQRGDER